MTAGLSANQYMETITGFSASLLQSLGGDTEKAAEYGNQAVIDMSDNANKMGTSMESIQNAYQGFAKQNYTMLDNLKIGYGGTKEEMQRLLTDAEKISGIKYDISSFADITQAIHVIQTEMGITGTTAEEAATTIQGSFGMLKASWENLMIGLTNPDMDLDKLMDDVINSAITLVGNVEPVIRNFFDSIPIAVETLGSELISKILDIANDILPQITLAAAGLLNAFAVAVSDNADSLSATAIAIVTTLVTFITDNLPLVVQTAMDLIKSLSEGLVQALPQLLPAAVQAILEFVEGLLDNIDMLVDVAINLILALADGLIQALPMLIEKAPEIVAKLVNAIIQNVPKIAGAAGQLIGKLVSAIVQLYPKLISSAAQIVSTIVTALKRYFTEAVPAAGKNMVEGVWKGIQGAKDWLLSKVKQWCGNILNGIKSFFGIHSPSTVMRDEVGKNIVLGLAEGIEENKTEVQKVMDEMNKELLDSEKKYNSESERLKESKSEADKAYLESLKETAEKERKLYDALQKDIENSKKNIISTFKDIAEKAYNTVDDVIKAQQSLESKLKDFGSLTTEQTIEIMNGKEIKATRLSDLEYQTKQLKEYENTLIAVKKRGNVPKEFFDEIRDMSIDDGLEFSKLLVSASDEEFNKYISDWKEKQSTAERISKELYADEAELASKQILDNFTDVPEEFFNIGEESMKQFGEGFMSKVGELLKAFKEHISADMGAMFVDGALAYAGSSNSYTDNSSLTVIAGSQSEHSIIEAYNQNKTYNKHVRGW